MKPLLHDRVNVALLGIALLGLICGIALWLTGRPLLADLAWALGVLPVLAALVVEIAQSLRQREFGLDIVAALSMSAALLFGETLAAAVVALMYSGGTFLEGYAEGRARREMSDLLSRVPRTATRHRNDALEEVPLDEIVPGDLILIRQGDVVPADGTLASGRALMDQSALTGESMPVRLEGGQDVMSGATNAGDAVDIRVTRRAAESTYAGIVRLVEAAQKSRAPMARLADRYSLLFLLVTVGLATAAWWFTGDPIRAVAVLVVATPCPLILAVPVALVAGLSRAAHFGVLIKGARHLESLARIRTLILDKTGTLTDGRPQIVAIRVAALADPAPDSDTLTGTAAPPRTSRDAATAGNPGDTASPGDPAGPAASPAFDRESALARRALTADEVLYFAAALDQASKHPIAQGIVAGARARGFALPVPGDLLETPGEGVAGTIDGHAVLVGGADFVVGRAEGPGAGPAVADAGSVVVAVAVDGAVAGHIVLSDALRSGTPALLAGLRRLGIGRIVLATGDRRAVADAVTDGLGLDAVRADLAPDQKVLLVLSERKNGPVMMVGDGVNDAPALAAADVGVAMGARGAAASAEAADVVLLVDTLERLLPGIEVAQRARQIALQSVVAGIGLSVTGMIAAAFGYMTPVQGALLQEVIDVAVILNALRALRIVPARPAAPDSGDAADAASDDLAATGAERMRGATAPR